MRFVISQSIDISRVPTDNLLQFGPGAARCTCSIYNVAQLD